MPGGKREMALRSVMLVLCCPCVVLTACMLVRQGRRQRTTARRCLLVAPAPPQAHVHLLPPPPDNPQSLSDNSSDSSGGDNNSSSNNNNNSNSSSSDSISEQEKETGAAWDPVLHRLLNPGNRLFHLNERWGQLISGNVAAVAPCPAAGAGGVCPGTGAGSGDEDGTGGEGKGKGKGNKGKGKGAAASNPCPPGVCHITGTPRLVATVPRAHWRQVLTLFRDARDGLAHNGPAGPSRSLRGWESQWVDAACAALAAFVNSADTDQAAPDQDRFEVWQVDVLTSHLRRSVVQQYCIGAQSSPVTAPFPFPSPSPSRPAYNEGDRVAQNLAAATGTCGRRAPMFHQTLTAPPPRLAKPPPVAPWGGLMAGKPGTEVPTAVLSKTCFRASGPTTIWPARPDLCAQRAAGGACLSRAAVSIVASSRPRPPTAPTKARRSSCA